MNVFISTHVRSTKICFKFFILIERTSVTLTIHNTNNLNYHIYHQHKSPTPQSDIELLRSHVQHIINDGSESTKDKCTFCKSDNSIKPNYIWSITYFIDESKRIIDFIQFDCHLLYFGDQSGIYFKDVQCDIDNVLCFFICSSIPFILYEYTLCNVK